MKDYSIEIKDEAGTIQLSVKAESFRDALRAGMDLQESDWEPYAYGSGHIQMTTFNATRQDHTHEARKIAGGKQF